MPRFDNSNQQKEKKRVGGKGKWGRICDQISLEPQSSKVLSAKGIWEKAHLEGEFEGEEKGHSIHTNSSSSQFPA